ncbi:DUF4231 domain-containing protein [Yersinia enterocolitica]|nr:DUF4231 domain-containing protein [Yersinia enterocolitica]
MSYSNTNTNTNAITIANEMIEHFEKKANHNKNESLLFFCIALLGSLIAPIFFTLGNDLFMSKIIPSLISVATAFSISWLQLRKPQSLWGLYRSYQRKIESLVLKYNFNIEPFNNSETKDAQMIELLCNIKEESHDKWMQLVPKAEAVSHSSEKVNKEEE